MTGCGNTAVAVLYGSSTRPDASWGQNGFPALFVAQSLGAFNDNLYKMVVSLLLIDMAVGEIGGSRYLSLTTAVFVLPYLLFSGMAGTLADRCDKRRVLIVAKAAEILLSAVALSALLVPRVDFLLVALFLLTAQATFFSPAKYALLPEIVPDSLLARANGLLEMGRFLGIILGTVAGGGALWLWQHQPVWIGATLIAVAIAGCLASLRIAKPRHPAAHAASRRAAVSGPLRHVLWLGSDRVLGPTVLALVFFDFLSALSMLDLLLIAKQAMALDDLRAGLLGGFAGCGIALGSLLAGRFAEGRLRAVLPMIGAAGIGAAFLLAGSGTGHYGVLSVAAMLIGLFGGLYLVPLLALLQRSSPPQRRGTILAICNFFGMAGVLVASAVLWLLCDVVGLSASRVMMLCGIVTLGVAVTIRFGSPAAFRLALQRNRAETALQHGGIRP